MQPRAPVSRIINTAVCLHEQSQTRASLPARVSDRFLPLQLLTARHGIRQHSPNVKHLDPKSIKADVRYVREIVRRVGKDRWVIKDRQGIVEYSCYRASGRCAICRMLRRGSTQCLCNRP